MVCQTQRGETVEEDSVFQTACFRARKQKTIISPCQTCVPSCKGTCFSGSMHLFREVVHVPSKVSPPNVFQRLPTLKSCTAKPALTHGPNLWLVDSPLRQLERQLIPLSFLRFILAGCASECPGSSSLGARPCHEASLLEVSWPGIFQLTQWNSFILFLSFLVNGFPTGQHFAQAP